MYPDVTSYVFSTFSPAEDDESFCTLSIKCKKIFTTQKFNFCETNFVFLFVFFFSFCLSVSLSFFSPTLSLPCSLSLFFSLTLPLSHSLSFSLTPTLLLLPLSHSRSFSLTSPFADNKEKKRLSLSHVFGAKRKRKNFF